MPKPRSEKKELAAEVRRRSAAGALQASRKAGPACFQLPLLVHIRRRGEKRPQLSGLRRGGQSRGSPAHKGCKGGAQKRALACSSAVGLQA